MDYLDFIIAVKNAQGVIYRIDFAHIFWFLKNIETVKESVTHKFNEMKFNLKVLRINFDRSWKILQQKKPDGISGSGFIYIKTLSKMKMLKIYFLINFLEITSLPV